MKIAILTVARSDYGIWRPLIKALSDNKKYKCKLIVSGSHFSKKFGNSYKEIVKDSYCPTIMAKIDNVYDKDTSEYSAKIISKISYSLGDILNKNKFDIFLLLGDRFEMAAAAITIVPFRIPIIHFHGGSVTAGAFDDNYRHAITKLSDYHMVETLNHKKRITQMGENKNNIKIIGAPSLSYLKIIKWKDFKYLNDLFNISKKQYVILTLHPETNASIKYNEILVNETLKSIKNYEGKVIITAPNADIYNNMILEKYDKFLKKNNKKKYIFKKHLGHELYFNLLKHCHFLIGNSSSGIIEAASFEVPFVNIGYRQMNRDCGANVIHTNSKSINISKAISKARQISKSNKLKNFKNIYNKGDSASLFIKFLDKNIISIKPKIFVDL